MEEILTRPAGRLGEDICLPAAEYMRPGRSGVLLFQTLLTTCIIDYGVHVIYSEFSLYFNTCHLFCMYKCILIFQNLTKIESFTTNIQVETWVGG